MVRKRSRQKSARSSGARGTPESPLLFGLHAVRAALANPARRHFRLYATREAIEALAEGAGSWPEAGRKALETAKPMERAEISARLTEGAVHQGAALEAAPLPDPGLESLDPAMRHGAGPKASNDGPVIVLDQVSDPHNIGAILRSAAAFGAAALIMQSRHAPPPTGALAKAASGALEAVPLITVTNIARALDDLKAMGYWVAGLDAAGETPLAEALDRTPLVIVLGAEGSGLRRLTAERCDLLARIPMTDTIASLNVSNAAAVTLYEASKNS